MRGLKWFGVAGLVAVVAVPALAGEGKKCSYSTQECLDYMSTTMKDSGWIGVEIDMDEKDHVWVVKKVVADSPAEGAGIQIGDVLFARNGLEIANEKNKEALMELKKKQKVGSEVTYTIKRNGANKDFTLTLAPMPADLLARYIGEHMMEHASAIKESGEESAKKN